MDFVVEDGTIVEDATSYVTLDFSNDYLGDDWAEDDDAKQSALMTATEYADMRWGDKLQGEPEDEDQELEFPRLYLYNRYGKSVDGVPDDWKKAICLYAKEADSSTLYPSPSSKTAKDIESKTTVVGPITTTVKYRGMATDATWLKFPLADKLARQYTTAANGAGTIRA